MNLTKFSLATFIGGVTYFFFGWLIFGILLRDLMALPVDIAQIIEYTEDEFKISYMIVGCFLLGALHSLILIKWANVSTFIGGLKVSSVIGLLFSLAVGFSMASMFKMHSVDQIFINAAGEAICSGLMGGIIGWFFGQWK